MSTTATFTAISAASAASSAANASRARHERCEVTIMTYDSKTATVEQMQQYASCVQNNHPRIVHLEDGEVLAIKILIAACFIGIIIGASKALFSRWCDWVDVLLLSLCGAILGPILVVIGIGLYAGAIFLFS